MTECVSTFQSIISSEKHRRCIFPSLCKQFALKGHLALTFHNVINYYLNELNMKLTSLRPIHTYTRFVYHKSFLHHRSTHGFMPWWIHNNHLLIISTSMQRPYTWHSALHFWPQTPCLHKSLARLGPKMLSTNLFTKHMLLYCHEQYMSSAHAMTSAQCHFSC